MSFFQKYFFKSIYILPFFTEPLTSLHEGSEESGDMGSQNYFFDQRPSMVSFPSAFPPFEQPPLPKPPKGNIHFGTNRYSRTVTK